jgi:hypothetical protein
MTTTCSSETTGSTYMLNTKNMTFDDAESFCNDQGGHLVAYNNLEEQQEVEQCFINQGSMLPNFNKFYWIGLKTGDDTATWPNFTWIDHSYAIYYGNYQHWGTVSLANGVASLEPNNLVAPPEECAGGNFSNAYTRASGWGDANCNRAFPFICEMHREFPLPRACLRARLANNKNNNHLRHRLSTSSP